MYIDKFLKNHPQIKVSKQVLNLCKVGEEKMRNSIDPLHDNHHIERLLNNLKLFLRKYSHHHKINFETLLLSICWHDVWKAERNTFNPIKLIYYQIYEGIGSMIIFSKHSINNIPKQIIKKVNYSIRKHAQFQFFNLSTVEAKILKDIDDLDILHARRLRPLLRKRKKLNIFIKTFGILYLNYHLNKDAIHSFEFTWTKKRAKKISRITQKILAII